MHTAFLSFLFVYKHQTATGLGGYKINVCALHCHVPCATYSSHLCYDVSNVMFAFGTVVLYFFFVVTFFFGRRKFFENARHANGKRKYSTSWSIISGVEFDQGFLIVDSGTNEGSNGILHSSSRHLLAFLIKKFSWVLFFCERKLRWSATWKSGSGRLQEGSLRTKCFQMTFEEIEFKLGFKFKGSWDGSCVFKFLVKKWENLANSLISRFMFTHQKSIKLLAKPKCVCNPSRNFVTNDK